MTAKVFDAVFVPPNLATISGCIAEPAIMPSPLLIASKVVDLVFQALDFADVSIAIAPVIAVVIVVPIGCRGDTGESA